MAILTIDPSGSETNVGIKFVVINEVTGKCYGRGVVTKQELMEKFYYAPSAGYLVFDWDSDDTPDHINRVVLEKFSNTTKSQDGEIVGIIEQICFTGGIAMEQAISWLTRKH